MPILKGSSEPVQQDFKGEHCKEIFGGCSESHAHCITEVTVEEVLSDEARANPKCWVAVLAAGEKRLLQSYISLCKQEQVRDAFVCLPLHSYPGADPAVLALQAAEGAKEGRIEMARFGRATADLVNRVLNNISPNRSAGLLPQNAARHVACCVCNLLSAHHHLETASTL